jgi:hypothetical protein
MRRVPHDDCRKTIKLIQTDDDDTLARLTCTAMLTARAHARHTDRRVDDVNGSPARDNPPLQ